VLSAELRIARAEIARLQERQAQPYGERGRGEGGGGRGEAGGEWRQPLSPPPAAAARPRHSPEAGSAPPAVSSCSPVRAGQGAGLEPEDSSVAGDSAPGGVESRGKGGREGGREGRGEGTELAGGEPGLAPDAVGWRDMLKAAQVRERCPEHAGPPAFRPLRTHDFEQPPLHPTAFTPHLSFFSLLSCPPPSFTPLPPVFSSSPPCRRSPHLERPLPLTAFFPLPGSCPCP
jgi:hypothetical protein